jgi:hypothetical protein
LVDILDLDGKDWKRTKRWMLVDAESITAMAVMMMLNDRFD